MILPLICFLVCHGGPAAHFADFSHSLESKGYRVEILATGAALAKNPAATEFNPQHQELDLELANEVAQKCRQYDCVITDMGHPFMQQVHKCLEGSKTRHYAYYDNPEKLEGSYFEIASRVASVAQGVLFANTHLAQEELFKGKKIYGIGYYPFAHAEKIRKKREQKAPSSTRKILCFGGNNAEYFADFPLFLDLLEGVTLPKNTTLVLQQHPGAKKCTLERKEIEKRGFSFPFSISNQTIDEALIEADVAIYFQTSMNVEFLAIGIPLILQVGKREGDILVKERWAVPISNKEQLQKALEQKTRTSASLEELYNLVGYSSQWPENLTHVLNE